MHGGYSPSAQDPIGGLFIPGQKARRNKMKSPKQFLIGTLFGAAIAMAVLVSMGAAPIGPTWMKGEVTPVCFLKADIRGFIPLYGEDARNTWKKEEVTAMLEVKAEQSGFIPIHGQDFGIRFKKNDIRPFVSVIPDGAAFVPVR
jgi:hypothetical protein